MIMPYSDPFSLNSISAEVVPISESPLPELILLPLGQVEELRHIENFRRKVFLSYKENNNKKVVKKLWDEEPSISYWCSGKSLDIIYNDEEKRIRISQTELYNIYIILLKSKNTPMCNRFFEDNRCLETLIKEIAQDQEQREAFLKTLLASDTRGISDHIHTVLQFFPHDLLERIKTTQESLPTTLIRSNQIKVLNLVLTKAPYINQAIAKKNQNPLYIKFPDFYEKITQNNSVALRELLANDSNLKRWLLGEPISDKGEQKEIRITPEELQAFVLVVLRGRCKDFYEPLLLKNVNLISTISSSEKSVEAIMAPLFNTKNKGFMEQFLYALVEANDALLPLIMAHRSVILAERNKKTKTFKVKQIKFEVLSSVLTKIKTASAKDCVQKNAGTRAKKRVLENKDRSPSPKRRLQPKAKSPEQSTPPQSAAQQGGKYSPQFFGTPSPISSDGYIDPALLHKNSTNASLAIPSPQAGVIKDSQNNDTSTNSHGLLSGKGGEKISSELHTDTSTASEVKIEDRLLEDWLNVLS